MANNSNVIDELVVKLTLDADEYEKSEKNVTVIINKTEKTLDQVDRKRKKRNQDEQKRWKESTKSVKEFGASLGKLAFTIGSVLGVSGGVAGLVGAVTALTGFETNLRRAAVSTGLSNRELQAWGSTARRLGADADSGAASLAALAKEQQQFQLTGNGPTLAAFSRIGVNAGPGRSIADIIGDAQKVYRQAAPAQRGQIEAGLSASGVSNDIIVMLKSEKDAREEFAKSFEESTTENRKALDAVSDALSAVQNAALNLANSIATIVMPYVEQFAKFASDGAQKLSAFADKVADAGGGMQGFTKVLKQQSPELADALDKVTTALKTMGEAVEIAAFGLKLIGKGFHALFNWFDEKLSFLTGGGGKTNPLKDAVGTVVDAVKWAWGESLNDARGGGRAKLTAGAAARVANSDPSLSDGESVVDAPQAVGRGGTRGRIPTSQLRDMLISAGYSVDQAAAIAANAERESGGGGFVNSAAINTKGGGRGARGLFQHRGARISAFEARYGVTQDKASIEQQIAFLSDDAYERSQVRRAFAQGGTAAQLASSFNDKFEVNGVLGEAARRATIANNLASGASAGGTGGPMVNINGPVTVQTTGDPQNFVGNVTRVSNVQNYNTSTR